MAEICPHCLDEADCEMDGLPEAVARVANMLNAMYDDPELLGQIISRIDLRLRGLCIAPLLN